MQVQIKIIVADDAPDAVPANPIWFDMDYLPRTGDTVFVAGQFGVVQGVQWEPEDGVGGLPRLFPCVAVLV